MIPGSTRELQLLVFFDFQPQKSRNPMRCQRSTVSGFTSKRASLQRGRRLAKKTTRPRSRALKSGRLTLLDATMSCWRSRAFSISNSVRERATSAMRPANTGRGRVASRTAARIRFNISICSKPAGSSRLVRNENLNDHAAEESNNQHRSIACRLPFHPGFGKVNRCDGRSPAG